MSDYEYELSGGEMEALWMGREVEVDAGDVTLTLSSSGEWNP